jgi:hypothetical protein
MSRQTTSRITPKTAIEDWWRNIWPSFAPASVPKTSQMEGKFDEARNRYRAKWIAQDFERMFAKNTSFGVK